MREMIGKAEQQEAVSYRPGLTSWDTHRPLWVLWASGQCLVLPHPLFFGTEGGDRVQASAFTSQSPLPSSRFSHVRLSANPWTVARQAPLSMEFSSQEHWRGLPFPSSERAVETLK